jgi:MYXO-CTERM domain-containing protein
MIYQNEPGALNEAWSDIMAAVCSYHSTGTLNQNVWTMGEDLPINAIRYLNNPTQDGISRDLYADRYLGDQDEGGVHINSGIGNLSFYLLTNGGSHPRQVSLATVEGIGIENAAQIYYRALTTYMNQTTDFAGARVATERAAADLFGEGSSEAVSVSEAWYAVGVGGPAPERIEEEPDPEPDPGAPGAPGSESGSTSSGVVGGCAAGGTGGGSLSLLILGLMAAIRRRRRS